MKQISNQDTKQNKDFVNSSQRLYICLCKKNYRSYPALYTHIKNKHQNEKDEYILKITRPQGQQIEKGRPKKHKDRPIQAIQQGQLLNIIEILIITIVQILRSCQKPNDESSNPNKQLLKGNQVVKFTQVHHRYQVLKHNIFNFLQHIQQNSQIKKHILRHLKSKTINNCFDNQEVIKIYKEHIKFKHELVEHFTANIQSNILIQLQLLQIQKQLTTFDQQSVLQITNQIQHLIWKNYSAQISIKIRQAYLKWIQKLQQIYSKKRNIDQNINKSQGKVRKINKVFIDKQILQQSQGQLQQKSIDNQEYQQKLQQDYLESLERFEHQSSSQI